MPRPQDVVALPRDIGSVSQVRGTVLVSSRRSLRARGYLPAYEAHLPPDARDELAAMTAAAWYPRAIADAHYAACDALGLRAAEIDAIGAESGRFINETVLRVVARLSREMGATPWVLMEAIPKLIERTWAGGAIGVVRVGPKEAKVTWAGQPLAANAYFRDALRAFFHAVVMMFTATAYTRVVTSESRRDRAVYATAWV